MKQTVYLDNAATSFPKPQAVCREVEKCIRTYCGNPGRSSHKLSVLSAEKIYACREALSDFLNLGAPERVVFTLNTTYALNTALYALINHGDHVITGISEHNSVLRPLDELKKRKYITVSKIDTLLPEDKLLAQLESRINPKTKAIVLSHASNVIPLVLPLGKIGALCKNRGVLLITDCAQSAGVYSIDMVRDNIAIACVPSHKGLFGIQGAGALCISKDIDEKHLYTVFQGGNGTLSASAQMPDFLPERFEAGTLPTPAIASLYEGIKFVNSVTLEQIREKNKKISLAVTDRLSSLEGITVYQPQYSGSLVSFNINGIPSEQVASMLDERGVCVRAGLHCAPDIHKAIGTEETGTIRISFGYFNTTADADKLYLALKDIKFSL